MCALQEWGPVAALTDDPVHATTDWPPELAAATAEPRQPPPVWRLRVLVLVVAAVVVSVDQVTKSLAVIHLSRHPVHLFASIYLRLQFNSGAAFSLFQGAGFWIALVAIGLVCILVLATRWVRSKIGALAIGLVLGGALGNLADRLFRANHGAVIDFIYTRYWPTFNVADACIVVGAALLIISGWHRPAGSGGPKRPTAAPR